jgi:hypothetical protein
VVAAEHQRSARLYDVVDQLSNVARGRHRRLVEHQTPPGASETPSAAELKEQRREARARNAGTLLELAGSSWGHGNGLVVVAAAGA